MAQLVITDPGRNRTTLVRELNSWFGCGLMDASDIADGVPVTISKHTLSVERREFLLKLEAQFEIRPTDDREPLWIRMTWHERILADS